MELDRNVYAKVEARATDDHLKPPGDGRIGPPSTKSSTTQPRAAEKLVKYFPAEAFALYAGLEPACGTAFSGAALSWALWIALSLSVALCVLALKAFWKVKRPTQILISCAALVVYVAALGGPFANLSWFNAGYALIASILMTAFIVFVKAPAPPQG